MKEKIKMILFLLLGISGLISVFFSSEIAVSQQSNIKTNISTTQVACATDFFQQEINDLFPNYTLYYYERLNYGTSTLASYYRILDNTLRIKHVDFDENGEIISEVDIIPLPLSENIIHALETEPFEKVLNINGLYRTLYVEDLLDMKQIPVYERVVQVGLHQDAMAFLVEDDKGDRQVQLVSLMPTGEYKVCAATSILPAGAELDLFHSSDGEIYINWNSGRSEACYSRSANNDWRWSWARFPSEDGSFSYSSVFCGVSMYGAWTEGNLDYLLIGSMEEFSLDGADLSKLPSSEAELRKGLNRRGWAVVNCPASEECLQLLEAPDAHAKVLGEFFNGTPLQIKGQKGEWTEVSVGLDGIVGWMLTSHLAFGIEMDQVEPLFPQKLYVEILEKKQPAYLSLESDVVRKLDGYIHIVGVVNSNFYILLTSNGQTGYVPFEWMWAGNG